MGIKGIVIAIVLLAIIILYIRNITEIIIPARKSNQEIITVIISVIVIIGLMYLYGETWFHYLVGFLAMVLMLVTLPRRGITSRGFRSIKGISGGNWHKLKRVHVTKNNVVKVSLTGSNLYWDTHYYNKEDYDKIISILQENLSSDILKIN